MMNEWGIPTIYLQSLANEFVAKLAKRKIRVPDLAIAGGFSDEAHVFKALAMGAPNFKAVCMGRALMIPGMVGKNIGEWLKAGTLPKTVSKFGTKAEEIFVTYEELKARFGKDAEKLPLGAVGIYTATQKLRTGLQQLMAGPFLTSEASSRSPGKSRRPFHPRHVVQYPRPEIKGDPASIIAMIIAS